MNPKAVASLLLLLGRSTIFGFHCEPTMAETTGPFKATDPIMEEIHQAYLRYIPLWKLAPTQQDPPCDQIPDQPSPIAFEDLIAYLSSLPQPSRRMLDGIEQKSTDLQVWKSFRAKKRPYIATDDGGVLKTQGTHGWVISNGLTVLFCCAEPVDGPFETSSSTRCELSGNASALLFIDHLSQFWDIRHK